MKLLNEIPQKYYNDPSWILNYLKNNSVIGAEEVNEIEYFHCFWAGNLKELHLVSLTSLCETHPGLPILFWVPNKSLVEKSETWEKIKSFVTNPIELIQVEYDHFQKSNLEKLYSTYLKVVNDTPNPFKYAHKLAYASDIVRFVILYLYGGIWFDLDVYFLRNLNSIRIKRYLSQWGTEFVGNGAILRLEKNHDLIDKIIKINPKLPFYPHMSENTEMSSFLLGNNLDITILPATFFDILFIPEKDLPINFPLKTFYDFFRVDPLDFPPELYAYHWHNNWHMGLPKFWKSKYNF